MRPSPRTTGQQQAGESLGTSAGTSAEPTTQQRLTASRLSLPPRPEGGGAEKGPDEDLRCTRVFAPGLQRLLWLKYFCNASFNKELI